MTGVPTATFIGAVVILASVAGNALFGLVALRRDSPPGATEG